MPTNTQTTVYTAANNAAGVPRTYLNKTWYDKNLLEMARTKFVHAEYGQKRTIPAGSGKKAEFRRFNPFDPNDALIPLTEGVTPDGQDFSQAHVEVECAQYGQYVEVSDMLKKTAYDNIMGTATDLLGQQLGTVLEWITRDAMCLTTNVQYAGGNVSRIALDATDKLTTAEVRKAVRTLKKKKATQFTRKGGKPHFICICSPDATYDLQDDTAWQNVSNYQNQEQIYSGEIGRLFGVVFVESTEAKVYKQSVLNKVNANVTSGHDFVLKNAPTTAELAYLVEGNVIKAGDLTLTIASYNAATKTVTVNETFSGTDDLSADDKVWSEDAGACDAGTKAGADIHATLVFGQNAYGVVDIDGGGNVQSIVKGLGSAGSADPLDQRATVGAKVESFCAAILDDDWIVRIEHGVSS